MPLCCSNEGGAMKGLLGLVSVLVVLLVVAISAKRALSEQAGARQTNAASQAQAAQAQVKAIQQQLNDAMASAAARQASTTE
jgi:uncharacterized protein YpmS